MDKTSEAERLKRDILLEENIDKQKLVDRLIELEGMKSMDFFQSILSKAPFREGGILELRNAAGYGVRQLVELRANQSKAEFQFCPHCASSLTEYKILDPYMTGLKCKNHHCYHIEVKHGECKDKKLVIDKSDTVDIAVEWLTNINFRKEIQNQVAKILRKYIAMHQKGSEQNEENLHNNFCPVCSLALEEFRQVDIWVKGLKCSNNHTFYERNGLSYKLSRLEQDITKTRFASLVNSYLNEELLIEHLPEQIVKLLTDIVKE